MLPALLLAALGALASPVRAQPLPADVDPLHARLLVVGDFHLEGPFGRRLKRRLRDEMPTWKVAVFALERFEASAVDALIRDDDAVVVVAAGSELVEVSTAAKTVGVGDLSQVEAAARLIVKTRGRRCLWVGPPQQLGRAWARYKGAEGLSDRLSRAVRDRARGCEYVDSLAYTRGGAGLRYEDGLRLRPEPAQRWAEEVAARLIRLAR